MELAELIIILEEFQTWRRFDGEIQDSPEMVNPILLGLAIEKILEHLKSKDRL